MLGVTISRATLATMTEAARMAVPDEACGLLTGTDDRIDGASVARNVALERWHRFEIDPTDLFAAMRAERAGGARIAGYWHSHPNGVALPSPTDAEMAAPDGRLWLIVAENEVTAWRAVVDGQMHGRFVAVTLSVIDGDPSALAP